jgi:ubiquinone/menaquinone biosynthesis C-methylase UbiE
MNETRIDTEAFKAFEPAGWVEVAGRYAETFARLTEQAIEPLLDATGVRLGTRALDVASGPGHLVAVAARRGAHATGVDFSSTMVAEARRLHPNAQFREGDAEDLPFADGSFDAVTIAFGMLHFARPDRALVEAYRVLAPGGRLAFTVWDAPERAVTFGLILRAIEANGDKNVPLPAGPDFFRFSDPDEIKRSLASAGFEDPSVTMLDLVWRVPSADALLEIFLEAGVRTTALLRAQTPERLAAIRAKLRELARPYERDGELELETPCVLASARRP